MPATQTIVFTDIVDSTAAKIVIGDEKYLAVLERHNRIFEEIAGQQIVKSIGDSFMLRFDDPADATLKMIDAQRRLTASPLEVAGKPLAVRIGIHMGNPISTDSGKDLSGTTVDQAARYESLANGGQILISNEVHSNIVHGHRMGELKFYSWGPYFLKGVGWRPVYEVLWDGKAPVPPSGKRLHRKRRFLGPFVGRQKELEEIKRYFSDPETPLITLKGPGGIGKTRLADEIEHRMAQAFDDGIYFVELESTENDETAVEGQIRAECGIKTGTLAEFFQNKAALLVLNNFESVTKASALVAGLLHECGGFRVLATSQVPLKVPGEQIWDVDRLVEADAEAMFLKYAQRHDRNFSLGPADRKLLDDLLKFTDRFPFCLELAAARVRPGRSFKTIVEGIGKSLDNLGAEEIQSGRHRRVQACLDWSFNLLSETEKGLYPKLSVFQGGFLPPDVDAVCSTTDSAVLLDRLSDASMLRIADDRYYLLPTAYEYAKIKLGDAAASLRQRHAEQYLVRLEEADAEIRGPKQHAGYAWLRAEFENCRAGIEWSIGVHKDEMVVRYSLAFANRLALIGRAAEQLTFCEAGLEAARRIGTEWRVANAENNLAIAYDDLPGGDRAGNLRKAIDSYEGALRVWTEPTYPREWAMTRNNLGAAYAALPGGDRTENLAKAIDCYEAALHVRTERDLPKEWATTQNNLGVAYQDLPSGDRADNLAKAIGCYNAALRVRTELDYPLDWAMTQINLGAAYANLSGGDRTENLQNAITYYEAALRVLGERDCPLYWAVTQKNLAIAYSKSLGNRKDNLRKAIDSWKAAIRGFRSIGMHQEAEEIQRYLDVDQAELDKLD